MSFSSLLLPLPLLVRSVDILTTHRFPGEPEDPEDRGRTCARTEVRDNCLIEKPVGTLRNESGSRQRRRRAAFRATSQIRAPKKKKMFFNCRIGGEIPVS